MRKPIVCALGAAWLSIVMWSASANRAEAQTPQAAGTPPVGRIVELTLVAWPASTAPAAKVNGKLLAMTDQWIIVADGTYEVWVPKDKVMTMRASR